MSRLLVAAALLALAAGPAWAQRLGDFGRPAYPYDASPPPKAAGATFNLTDEERDMHNRIWRFLVAPHAAEWFRWEAFERLEPTEVTHYYAWLQRTDFRSSRTRYTALADAIRADLGTIPTTFAAICAVIEVDRRRAVALRGVAGIGPQTATQVAARHADNSRAIDRFVWALGVRDDSYTFAQNHLLVETPHEEAMIVDGLLGELSVHVAVAERGDFCGWAAGGGEVVVIRPRELITKS